MSGSIYQRKESATKFDNFFRVKMHRSETPQHGSNACQDPNATVDCIILQSAFLDYVLRRSERTVREISYLQPQGTKPNCRQDSQQARVRGLWRSGADDELDRIRPNGKELERLQTE